MAKVLRVGVLDLVTNKTTDAWFERHVMMPNFASIMPQAVGAWAEELGCEVFYDTYTGGEDLAHSIPVDLDVLFISCFSRSSFLAYAIAARYRSKGTVVVLGGPHARSFAAHARPYFDYICQITDKQTIRSLLESHERQDRAVVLNAPAQPDTLPSVEQRVRFVENNVAKNRARRWVRTVPMIGSVGCPYTCHFCVDAAIPYQTLPYAQLIEDLRYTERRFGSDSLVFWHDPNFGVRFDEYMGLIEESGTRLLHGGESSLSILGTRHLEVLRRNRWVAQFPGIESWNGFSDKGGTGKLAGIDKVRSVADHVNRILSYVPYVQTNFVLGLDDDHGDEPFELTKSFVDLVPGAFPGYSILTNFQNAPLSDQLVAEGRTFSVPHPFLDNTSAFNVRIKNYPLLEFYDRMIDLQAHTFGARAKLRRWNANQGRYVKLANLGRGITEGGWRRGTFERMRRLIARDGSFLRHYSGAQEAPPQFYFDQIRRMLGKWSYWLPVELSTPAGFVETERRAAAEPVFASRTPVAGLVTLARARAGKSVGSP
jgi:hypothetical protein